jgi:hypothetical protein
LPIIRSAAAGASGSGFASLRRRLDPAPETRDRLAELLAPRPRVKAPSRKRGMRGSPRRRVPSPSAAARSAVAARAKEEEEGDDDDSEGDGDEDEDEDGEE